MSAPRRNAPCPCGSGQKHKKCCLPKDEAAAREKGPPPPKPWTIPPPPPRLIDPDLPRSEPTTARREDPPPDPLPSRRNEAWERFEGAPPEEQLRLFEDALAEPDLMDGEMAFDVLSTLDERCEPLDQPCRLAMATATPRKQRPELFEEEARYVLRSEDTA